MWIYIEKREVGGLVGFEINIYIFRREIEGSMWYFLGFLRED